MTRHIKIPRGYKIDKATGKLVKCVKHLDVSTRLKKQGSQRVKVGKISKEATNEKPAS